MERNVRNLPDELYVIKDGKIRNGFVIKYRKLFRFGCVTAIYVFGIINTILIDMMISFPMGLLLNGMIMVFIDKTIHKILIYFGKKYYPCGSTDFEVKLMIYDAQPIVFLITIISIFYFCCLVVAMLIIL